ncbi:hypothetical protein [Endozoicomonas numazuensis]|uniref:hypothetical protein n=1 Tax=Endozoicomonas numazuensis TaxID=1137799 RepID=UPI00191BF5A0|nr:hypothetical protein [Endozoicomonas numazuensis]
MLIIICLVNTESNVTIHNIAIQTKKAFIPPSSALAAKGMGLGAVTALIIGSAGASLTEVILLKSLFKNKMIIAFLVVILSMTVGAGFLYQAIF